MKEGSAVQEDVRGRAQDAEFGRAVVRAYVKMVGHIAMVVRDHKFHFLGEFEGFGLACDVFDDSKIGFAEFVVPFVGGRAPGEVLAPFFDHNIETSLLTWIVHVPVDEDFSEFLDIDLLSLLFLENDAARDVYRVDGQVVEVQVCLLYTSPSPRDKRQSRMPSSA